MTTTQTATTTDKITKLKALMTEYNENEAKIGNIKLRQSEIAKSVAETIAPNRDIKFQGETFYYSSRKAKGTDTANHKLSKIVPETAIEVE